MRAYAFVYKVGYAVSKYACLSTACTRYNHHRAFGTLYATALCIIEGG